MFLTFLIFALCQESAVLCIVLYLLYPSFCMLCEYSPINTHTASTRVVFKTEHLYSGLMKRKWLSQ